MRSVLARFRRPYIAGLPEQLMLMNSTGDGSTLSIDFTTGVLNPRLAFRRASGGTYTGNDGLVYGMDFATSSSLAIGAGSKSVTLTATANVDRRYLVGQTVYISNGANNMSGPVTAYNASTQVLTIDATSANGSGSFTSWTVGNASARFDYDPTTLAPNGLLIEAAATNLFQQSADWTVSPWTRPAQITWDGTTYATAPDGTTSAKQITVTGGASASISQAVTTGTNRTISLWLRAGSLTSFSVGAFDSAGTTWGNNADSTCRIISGPGNAPVQQVGGLWSITGLLPTQWTRVQIFRSTTYTNLLAYPGSSSGTINGTAYAWGFQMEAGNGASSLIPTGASQGTRNEDFCSIVNPNFEPWYGSPTGWTIVADMTPQSRAAGSFPGMLALRSAADSGLRIYYYNDGTYNTAFRFATASTGVEVYGPNGVTYGVPRKFGASVTSGTQFASSAGVQIGSTQTLAVPMDQILLAIGNDGVSPTPAVNCRMHFRSIKYWPYAMTLAELNARTT